MSQQHIAVRQDLTGEPEEFAAAIAVPLPTLAKAPTLEPTDRGEGRSDSQAQECESDVDIDECEKDGDQAEGTLTRLDEERIGA